MVALAAADGPRLVDAEELPAPPVADGAIAVWAAPSSTGPYTRAVAVSPVLPGAASPLSVVDLSVTPEAVADGDVRLARSPAVANDPAVDVVIASTADRDVIVAGHGLTAEELDAVARSAVAAAEPTATAAPTDLELVFGGAAAAGPAWTAPAGGPTHHLTYEGTDGERVTLRTSPRPQGDASAFLAASAWRAPGGRPERSGPLTTLDLPAPDGRRQVLVASGNAVAQIDGTADGVAEVLAQLRELDDDAVAGLVRELE